MPFFVQNVVPLSAEYVRAGNIQHYIMLKNTTHISTQHGLRDGLTFLTEALIWAGCIHATSLVHHPLLGKGIANGVWPITLGILALAIVSHFIPNNTYSRTARRDEVVASAMKTGLAIGVLVMAFSIGRSSLLLASLAFCIALTVERLILNSWFARYSIRHGEQAVIICSEEENWQQALQQNTYGLKLTRLEGPTAQQLNEHLTAHPETQSVYCSQSSVLMSEAEAIAHVCHDRDITLHLLPWPASALNQAIQHECRGSVSILSPVKPPLEKLLNRIIKRLTDIALSLLVLLTIFPVFALVAYICIKRQSRGPVIIVRHMCGMNGKPFQCLSFRTRHYEAAPSFLDDSNDPGYFPFGKFLTVSRMEFLPQFLCVLWGSMTIVGSQTMRPEHYQNYKQELKQYLASGYCLKAGITAYRPTTQANGSAKADIWYYRNWGFWLDLRIMKRRIGTILSNSKTKSINYI